MRGTIAFVIIIILGEACHDHRFLCGCPKRHSDIIDRTIVRTLQINLVPALAGRTRFKMHWVRLRAAMQREREKERERERGRAIMIA